MAQLTEDKNVRKSGAGKLQTRKDDTWSRAEKNVYT